MEQEITLSKNIISYINDYILSEKKLFKQRNSENIFEILQDNLVVIDKNKQYGEILLNELNKLKNDVISKEFKKGFVEFLTDRISLVECRLNPDDNNFVFDLCNNSDDKIYFDPAITEEELKKTKLIIRFSEYGNIELHSINSFLKPDNAKHRFQNGNSFDFKSGNTYKWEDILKPYLRYSRHINFIDKYLPNNLSLLHIKKILLVCKNFREIIFTTLTKEDYLLNINSYNKPKAEESYSEFEKLINSNKNYKFRNINTRGHTERFIITDKFEIQLPGGLDQINKNGYPKIDSENKKMRMHIDKIK